MHSLPSQSGYTLVELVVSVAIAAMLLAGLQQLLSTSILATEPVEQRTELARHAHFAMARMERAVAGTDRLLIPLGNNPDTNYDENVREQTVPASPPQGSSMLATAVLAVTLDRRQDMDSNGVFDADNDGDGKFDEDLPADTHNDGKSGIRDFDDNGDGVKDFFLTPAADDDERFPWNEDSINGIDDDDDGTIDEDPGADMNGDGAPGIAGVDDDGDGSIDEGNVNDDDEDGQTDEDWFDPVVFYLQGSSLIERRAVPWDENGDSNVNGRDFVESTLADNVTLLRFERLPASAGQKQLVDITLALTAPDGESITVTVRLRLGAWR